MDEIKDIDKIKNSIFKRKYKRLGVLFLIMLLLLIFSLYLSLAVVNGLSNLKIKGNDGVSGYIRSNIDKFNFNVIAKNNGLQINPGHVRLLGSSNNSGFAFDSCVPSLDGSYECQLTRNMSGFVICPKVSLDVNLYDQNGNFIDDEQVTVICDTSKPVITASVDKQKYGAKDNVTISYSIIDTAYSSGFAYECAGVKDELRLSSGSLNKVYKINPGTTCSYSGSIIEPATVFNTGNISGQVDVNITAYDNFGQSGNTIVYFDTDFQGLSFVLAYFNVTDLGHNEIKYFMPMDVLLDFGVDILEKDFDESTIEADLKELGVENAVASCLEINEKKRCEWKNIRLFLQEPSISKTITVSGKDLTGNKKTSVIVLNKALTVDNKAPRFGNLQVKKQNGEKFNFTSTASQKVSVVIDILEPETGLNLNTVKADLSAFNPSVASYKNVQRDSCSTISQNLTRCTWDNINVNIGGSGFIHNTLKFSAGDKSGNNVSENIVYTIFIDDEAPVPVQFNVEGQQPETLNYVSPKGSTFALIIQEKGIGLDAKDVFLDASQLTGNARLSADNCTQQGDIYTCYWYNIKSQQVSGRSYISTGTAIEDKADNLVKGVLSLEVEIDNKEPVIAGVEQTPKYPTYEDKILFEAKVKDELSGIKRATFYPGSILNATELGMDCKAVEGSNESQRRDVKCRVELTDLEKKAKSDKIKINVEDFAGNKAEKILLLEVAEPIVTGVPDYFSVRSTGISPTRVPRKATTQVAFSMFGKVALSTRESNVQIIGMSADCTDSSYVERNSVYIINEGSTEPIIAFRLTSAVGSVTANEITVNCKLNMVIKKADKIFSKPEVENIELKIPLYDAPTGVADANVQAKISAIDEEINDLGKEIAAKQKFADILAMWCTISKLMGQLNSIFQNIKLLWYTITSFKEISAIAAIEGAITTGEGCLQGAIAAAGASCNALVVSCCTATEELVVLEKPLAAGIAKYQPLAKKGDIVAVAPAEIIAGLFLKGGTAAAQCPASAGFEACFVGASGTITKGTTVWETAKNSFVSICTKFGWFHSLVDNFIWPPGPFGIGGLASLPFGIIGMINKMGCAISYQCALCDWEDWMEVTVAAGQATYNKLVKGVEGQLPTGEPTQVPSVPSAVHGPETSQLVRLNDEQWVSIESNRDDYPLEITKIVSGTEELYEEVFVTVDGETKKMRLIATHSEGQIYQLEDESQIIILDDNRNVAYKTNLRVTQVPAQGTLPAIAEKKQDTSAETEAVPQKVIVEEVTAPTRWQVVSSNYIERSVEYDKFGTPYVDNKPLTETSRDDRLGVYKSPDGKVYVIYHNALDKALEAISPSQTPSSPTVSQPRVIYEKAPETYYNPRTKRMEIRYVDKPKIVYPTTKATYSGFPFTGQATGPPSVPKPEDYKPPQIQYKPDSNGWWNKIVETEAPEELKGATWIFNPYKSKPYAYACMCYPPIIYNLKKERQIKCMYRNCLQHELTSGITTSACDLAYKERQCLYVDGAQFKLFGNKHAMDNLVNVIAQKLPFLIGGLIYKSICGTYSLSGDTEKCTAAFNIFISTAGKHPVGCGIAGAVQTLLELKSVWDTLYGGFSYPGQELKGPDYCATAGFPSERRDY